MKHVWQPQLDWQFSSVSSTSLYLEPFSSAGHILAIIFARRNPNGY